MRKSVGIVDLFSGPGGLGEGFSAFEDVGGNRPFSIKVSIEKEPSAHATLRLRSFLRKFEGGHPKEYTDFLNERIAEPNWSELFPEEWAAAEEEVHCLELGKSSTSKFLKKRITEIRKLHEGRTVLIGGPPCQAYSLAGRSRNAGIADYVPHKDERNFLYQEYVNVLGELAPAVFVMENVKGMLSSAVKGGGIFQKVMSDLKSAAGANSYRLVALTQGERHSDWRDPLPNDFIVRTEDHGIPQARHRVIIVGLRSDVADAVPVALLPRLVRRAAQVNVDHVISDMPALRSGLSRADSTSDWVKTVKAAAKLVAKSSTSIDEAGADAFRDAIKDCTVRNSSEVKLARGGVPGTALPVECPADLAAWLSDRNLERLPNNDTRGHMPSDLGRYLFAAAFGKAFGRSPKATDFPAAFAPNHRNWNSGKFADRFRVQVGTRPARTITSHISKDGHYYIHPDPAQCRSLTVREAARLQTFPDNYYFKGNRTQQYVQVGNAVPPFLAHQIASAVWTVIAAAERAEVQFPVGAEAELA